MMERRIIVLLAIALALSIAAQWFVPHHAGFAISHYFGFYALSAVAGAAVIAVAVVLLPRIFRRQTTSSLQPPHNEAGS